MKIQEGRFYRARNGSIHGPIEFSGGHDYPLSTHADSWTLAGHYLRDCEDYEFDIVEEILPVPASALSDLSTIKEYQPTSHTPEESTPQPPEGGSGKSEVKQPFPTWEEFKNWFMLTPITTKEIYDYFFTKMSPVPEPKQPFPTLEEFRTWYDNTDEFSFKEVHTLKVLRSVYQYFFSKVNTLAYPKVGDEVEALEKYGDKKWVKGIISSIEVYDQFESIYFAATQVRPITIDQKQIIVNRLKNIRNRQESYSPSDIAEALEQVIELLSQD